MMDLQGVGVRDFFSPVVRGRYKVEVLGERGWVDISDYVINVSVEVRENGRGVEPVAGRWRIEIWDEENRFNPLNPEAERLIEMGRGVRISEVLKIGEEEYEWLIMSGVMDEPRYDVGGGKIEIGGMDYTQRLADCVLSGKEASWGDVAEFESVESPGVAGAEQYEESDACRIGEAEVKSVGDWVAVNARASLNAVDGGNNSNYAIKLTTTESGVFRTMGCENEGIVNLSGGVEYVIKVDFMNVLKGGTYQGKLIFYDGSDNRIDEIELNILNALNDMWQSYQKKIKPVSDVALKIKLYLYGINYAEGEEFYLDNISVKLYDSTSWTRYNMPEDCEGVYWVELDGEAVAMGDEGGKGGWHYDPDGKAFYFSEDMYIPGGKELLIYYYKEMALSDVLADLLVRAGLYEDRAEALEDMIFEEPGVSVGRVYFDDGVSGLEAIRRICERVNYRFYFSADGRPVFKPYERWKGESGELCSVDMSGVKIWQDINGIKNRVVIEGEEMMVEDVAPKSVRRLRYEGEYVDEESVSNYGEKAWRINNILFQSVESAEEMAEVYGELYSDPCWWIELDCGYCGLPVEVGDVYRLQIKLISGLEVDKFVRVSGWNINNMMMRLSCEVVSPPRLSVENVGVGVEMEMADIIKEGVVVARNLDMAIDMEDVVMWGREYEYTTVQSWTDLDVPSGASGARIQLWGSGGNGGDGNYIKRGGGGGGGAYALKTISVEDGDKLYINLQYGLSAMVKKNSDVVAVATAGASGAGGAAGGGGSAAGCVGDVVYGGGNGYYYLSGYNGGGGGSSAGVSSDGVSASGIYGAVAPAGGGDGGEGGEKETDGCGGEQPGGGGGGGGKSTSEEEYMGGAGALGKVIIRFKY